MFKGTVSVILSDPSCQDDNADLNLYLINNVEDIIVFQGWKVLNSDYILYVFLKYKCANHFFGETTIVNNQFSQNYKQWYSIPTWSD